MSGQPSGDVEQTEVLITRDDGKEERLAVTRVEHDTQEFDDDGPHDVGDEFWVVLGIHPRDTTLIPSSYVWLSGSLGDPRATQEGKFPLVYIPKNEELTVTEIEDSETDQEGSQ